MSQFLKHSLAVAVVTGIGVASLAASDSVANMLVYENDFKTRTSVCPIGNTTVFTYDNTGDTFVHSACDAMMYYADAVLISTTTWADEPQPLGLDGWRRLARYGTANIVVLNNSDENAGRGLRFVREADTEEYVYAATPIGSRISSGKLRIVADIRTPPRWASSSANFAFIAIGNDTLYNGLEQAAPKFATGTLGAFGIGIPNGSADKTKFYPGYNTTGTRTYDTTAECADSKWYRVQLVVDFANASTEYKLFAHGDAYDKTDFELTAEPIYAETVPFRSGAEPMVTTLSLQVKGLEANEGTKIWMDRIRVYQVGSPEDKLIYNNPFSSRKVDSVTEKVHRFVTERGVVTQDGFYRWGSGTGSILLTGGDDPALQFALNPGDGDTYKFAVAAQPLGDTFRARPMRVSIDMRPPSLWSGDGSNNRHMSCMLLGDKGTSLSSIAGSWFGICCTNSSSLGFNSTFFIRGRNASGSGTKDYYPVPEVTVNNTHWYRLVADVNNRTGTTTLNVYDLGTTKPTKATVLADDASPMATISDKPFYNPKSDIGGIATLAFQCAGSEYSPFDDKYSPLFDNIRVYTGNLGFILMVR